jgi:hypothetical protein
MRELPAVGVVVGEKHQQRRQAGELHKDLQHKSVTQE